MIELVDDLVEPVELCGRPVGDWLQETVDEVGDAADQVTLVVRLSTPLVRPATLRRIAAAARPGEVVEVSRGATSGAAWWESASAETGAISGTEALSVNDPYERARAEAALYEWIAARWLARGVVIEDPATVRIDGGVRLGAGVRVRPYTELIGDTAIGAGSEIGPMTTVRDSAVGEHCQIRYAVCQDVEIGAGGNVGPFAWLRSGTRLGEGCRAGAFVELSDSVVGAGTSVPHLAGLFSADVGRDCNLASMSGPANFNGVRKQRVRIGDNVSIGAGCILVAPVSIGDNASTGAGTVITEDVPDGALALARVPQRNVAGWARVRARE